MSKLKTCVLGVAGLTLLLVLGLMVDSRKARARKPNPGSAPVNIVSPLPVPVSGSLGISGAPNVDVTNLATIPKGGMHQVHE